MLYKEAIYNYKFFVPYPLFSFSHIWNPQNEKIITKEHLKLFLEEAFFYNFRIAGTYFVRYEKINYTPLSEFIYIYSHALFFYLYEKELIPLRSNLWEHNVELIIDSSSIYKQFSHLITLENFSLLLKKYSEEYLSSDFFDFENYILDFRFISSKEELLSLEERTIIFEIEDKEVFLKFLEEEFIELNTEKTNMGNLKIEKKLKFLFEDLEKYLKKKN